MPLAYLCEYASYVGQRFVLDALPEFQHRRVVTEAALRSEISDTQRPFQCERAAHQFPPDCDKRPVRQRPGVDSLDFFENFFFTVGCIYLAAGLVLQFAYLDYYMRTLVEQLDKLKVYLVYSVSVLFESHIDSFRHGLLEAALDYEKTVIITKNSTHSQYISVHSWLK